MEGPAVASGDAVASAVRRLVALTEQDCAVPELRAEVDRVTRHLRATAQRPDQLDPVMDAAAILWASFPV